MVQSYDYAHRQGIIELTWEEIAGLTRRLAEEVERQQVDIVLGIARAGLFPATAVACALRREFFPIRLSRWDRDVLVDGRWVPHPELAEARAAQGETL